MFVFVSCLIHGDPWS